MYINGATAVPSVRKIKKPNKNKKIIIGASHHFFLSDINSQNSFKIDDFDIFFLKIKIVFRNLDLAREHYRDYSNKTFYCLFLNLKNLFQLFLSKLLFL